MYKVAVEKSEGDMDTAAKDRAACEIIAKDIEENKWSPERVFKAFDVNSDGLLSEEELACALTSLLGREFELEEAQSLMTKFDSTGDRHLENSEFIELVEYAKKDVMSIYAWFVFKTNDL